MKKSQQHALAFLIFIAAAAPATGCYAAAAWFLWRSYVAYKKGD